MKKIEIKGEIGWDILPVDFHSQLNASSGDVLIEISSPGGYVIDGIEMYIAMTEYDRGKIITRNVGECASIASYLLLAGDEIEAYDNTVYMIHNAWGIAIGDHREMRSRADVVEGLTNMIAKTYVSKTGKSIEEVHQLLDNDSYFFGDEMLEHGFVDRLLPTDKEKDKSGAVALATERVKACIVSTREHHGDIDTEKVAALLNNQNWHMKQSENTPIQQKGKDMDISTLTAQMLDEKRPDLMKAIREEAFAKGESAGKESGAKAEQARIASIEAESEPGYEHIIGDMKADTSKTATDAIVAIHQARKQKMADAGNDRAADGQNLAEQAAALGGAADDDGKDAQAAQKAAAQKAAGSAMLSKTKTKPQGA